VERIVTIVVETACFDFIVPNVFTPDFAGTGALGAFDKVLYIKTENLSAWSITIYDRWGKEMFKSTDPDAFWDGNTEGGSKAPDGVYYYIISATCQNNAYKKDGFVQVIR
jgi:gliding motility-associated-like protein